jgi:hypothetical protein
MTLLRTDPSARRPPPPGARETVMRDGLRRRRLAFAGAGSAAAVAIVAVAGLLAGTTAGSDSLRVDQPAGGSSTSGPDAVAMAGTGPGGVTAFGRLAGTGTASGPKSAPGAPLADPRPSAQATGRPADSIRRREPMTRQRESQVCGGDSVAVGTSGVRTGDWCMYLTTPTSHDPNTSLALSFGICRNAAKERAALTYLTTEETDFTITVSKTKKVLWRWSTGQRFPNSRHVLMVGGTDCYFWSTAWDWRDDAGKPVAASQALQLTAESTSRELAYEEVSTTFSS